MLLVIAISLWVGGCNLFSSLTEGSSSIASEAKEDSVGNAVVVVATGSAVVEDVAIAVVVEGFVDVTVAAEAV